MVLLNHGGLQRVLIQGSVTLAFLVASLTSDEMCYPSIFNIRFRGDMDRVRELVYRESTKLYQAMISLQQSYIYDSLFWLHEFCLP